MFSTLAKRCAVLSGVLILSLVIRLQAQEINLKPVTSTYVLRNVTVITSPGSVINDATLVIKDGLIHAVGTDVSVPVDAIPVDADSLTVYAGFIDGLSQTGIKQPKEDNNRNNIEDPGNPPNDLAGITPNKTIRENLEASEKSIGAMRQIGFTMSHVVPGNGMLPGKGSVVLLAGDGTDDMIFQENVSLFSTLNGARRMYPSTVMGVMAKYREIYRNAELLKRNQGLYASNPSGMKRPGSDYVTEAFLPVLDGQLPVMFEAEGVKDVQRVMTLQEELGFKLMIAGIKQGWDVTDAIKSANIPVFLSLDLPEWEEDKKDSAAEEMSEEKKALVERKNGILLNHYTLPAKWSDAGLRFGFSSMGAKSTDIHKVLTTMKEKGVSEDVLLAGLTTGPAALLGLSRVAGTVEPGKLANLVVTHGNYFDKDAKVKYVFVEGEMFTYDSKPSKTKGDNASASPEGTWSYSAETPNGTGKGEIILEKDGAGYTGKIQDGQTGYSFDLSNILVDGSKLSFEFNYSDGSNQFPLSVEIEISGNTFSGLVDGGSIGSFPIEGTRVPEK
ncbi:MAG: amidohydrolase family protein [Cyclobacteriaceae bacterium]